jgi:hypothetical protein
MPLRGEAGNLWYFAFRSVERCFKIQFLRAKQAFLSELLHNPEASPRSKCPLCRESLSQLLNLGYGFSDLRLG